MVSLPPMFSWFKKSTPAGSPLQQLRSKVLFLNELTSRELGLLESIAHERQYMPGEIIFDEGEEGVGMYLVLEGKVRIFRKGMTGNNHDIALIPAGEFFGELALLDCFPRTASAAAVEPTLLLGFFRPEIMDVIQDHPRMGMKFSIQLARHLGSRLRDAMEKGTGTTVV